MTLRQVFGYFVILKGAALAILCANAQGLSEFDHYSGLLILAMLLGWLIMFWGLWMSVKAECCSSSCH
jgi:hypothetical protein